VLADDRGIAVQPGVRAGMADVDDAAVLDVGARADADVVDVAAHHRAGPDGNVVGQGDIADDDGGRINVDALAERRERVPIRSDVHARQGYRRAQGRVGEWLDCRHG